MKPKAHKLQSKRASTLQPKSSPQRHVHIAITGTPGTGKSTLAKNVAALLNIPLIDLTAQIKAHKLYKSYDTRAKTYDVHIPTLEKYLAATLGKAQSYIIDSHLAHHLSKKSQLVTHVIVCTCNLKVLQKRLRARKYSAQKIADNLEAEIFDTCAAESLEYGYPTIKIDCTKKLTKNQIRNHLRRLLRPVRPL